MVYKYRGTIPGSKIFMREYEIKGDTTLYQLHNFLLNDFGFAPDQMVIFRGLKNGANSYSEYGLFDMGDGTMDTITIDKLVARKEDTLEYIFDIKKDRFISFAFLGEVEPQFRASYPRLVAEKGRDPEQFAKGYDDFDQIADPIDDGGDELAFDEDELPEGQE